MCREQEGEERKRTMIKGEDRVRGSLALRRHLVLHDPHPSAPARVAGKDFCSAVFESL